MRSNHLVQLEHGDVFALKIGRHNDRVVLTVFDKQGEIPLIQAQLTTGECNELLKALFTELVTKPVEKGGVAA